MRNHSSEAKGQSLSVAALILSCNDFALGQPELCWQLFKGCERVPCFLNQLSILS